MGKLTESELQYITSKYYNYSEEDGAYPQSITIESVDKFKFYYRHSSNSIYYFFIKDDSLIHRNAYLHDYHLAEYIARDLGRSDTKLMFEYLILMIPSILEVFYKKELKSLNDKYRGIEANSVKNLSEKIGKIP